MDQIEKDRNATTIMHWSVQQFDKFLCTLCYFLVFPPMQLICCGQRVCENCATSKLQELFQCPFCSEQGVPQARHDRGYQRELDRQQINCPRCIEHGSQPFINLPEHLIKHRDLPCKYCDQMFIFPQQLKKHQHEDCKNRVVPCPLAFLGCLNEVPYNKISQHYLGKIHQQHLVKFIRQILPEYSRRNSKFVTQKIHDEKYHRSLTECLTKMNSLLQEVDPIIATCAQLSSMRQTIATKINELRAQVGEKIKETSDNSAKLLENLQGILVNMHKLLDEIKSKPMSGPQLLSLDNTYIWKVNFATLISNTQTLVSEAIHTSQSGYRMSLSCEIFIDTPSQKRYISISLTILRGEFDAILSWPMTYPILLSIIDLTATKQHISRSIPYDSRATTFHRPINDKNFPCRICQFSPLDALVEKGNRYIQDDSIFIQLHIDFTAPTANPTSNKSFPKPIEDPIQRNIVQNLA